MLHVCMDTYIFTLLHVLHLCLQFRTKAAQRTLMIESFHRKCKAYIYRSSYKCKINDALSQHFKLLVKCSIDVYSLYFSTGKCLEQLMTFIFGFF